ncbi:hypothetical protein AA23498_0841 [Acetobacter nitrogenifigens DSM 23921 = NBRC 105050]|uniref:Uncharacterized protein n=1 Tax=Acetobacter nitrogenifigens DSM 23921 = NBRC 105050 TaxID=1120919 RepID=A0A511XCS2_9PROT|nr:hypothetical protein [Acetobacter nitrogenifigens]GBQ90280.1 hypothetical protein AA23498_0841 [Acetobacter nitrogenifigens DSM 23921 = NBRC 105050]GEN60675.1 hypothetical protein ANI02nite_25590 [Acetobacter nitrogenifigens DSM 23921 = NBRC 105050]
MTGLELSRACLLLECVPVTITASPASVEARYPTRPADAGAAVLEEMPADMAGDLAVRVALVRGEWMDVLVLSEPVAAAARSAFWPKPAAQIVAARKYRL